MLASHMCDSNLERRSSHQGIDAGCPSLLLKFFFDTTFGDDNVLGPLNMPLVLSFFVF